MRKKRGNGKIAAYHAAVRQLAEQRGIKIPEARILYGKGERPVAAQPVPAQLAAVRPSEVFDLAESNIERLKNEISDLQNQVSTKEAEQAEWQKIVSSKD